MYIAGLEINPPIMNASGIFSYSDILKNFDGVLGALVGKSVSLKEKHGYETPVIYRPARDLLMNAMGLPNPGAEAYATELAEFSFSVPFIVSLVGETPEEFAECVDIFERIAPPDAYELNVSCPHPKGNEGIEMIYQNKVADVTRAVKAHTHKPVIEKLSAVPQIGRIAYQAVEAGADAISAINTVPGLSLRNGRYELSNRAGGISGPAIKPIGLKAVMEIRQAVGVPVIGMGGIETAADVRDYMHAGADAVALGTVFCGMDTETAKQYLENLRRELYE
ncbi:MAG: nitronate monooxygenase [Candidatus Aenigmarchaeota archaeon]|nr:nitronate monooxygenase [Candidatus Aenigmarchaeota archaeon]